MNTPNVLILRDCAKKAVRDFFYGEGFLEVDTPLLVPYENPDDNVENVKASFKDFKGREYSFFLHTSPEFFMKRLVWQGAEKIFQVSKVFRDGETGAFHNIEFTMVEWYRVGADYRKGMEEVEGLVKKVAQGLKSIGFNSLIPSFEFLSVKEAFDAFAGVKDVFDKEEVIFVSKRDSYEEGFFYLLVDKVERSLKSLSGVFLYDYPEEFSAMAVVDNGVAKRFEFYLKGVEIANGYTELSDYESYYEKFAKKGERAVDFGFLNLLKRRPLPFCEGVALGFDRLLTGLLGKEDIKEVLPFHIDDLIKEVESWKD